LFNIKYDPDLELRENLPRKVKSEVSK